MVEPYQAIGLVPTMWGIRRREDIRRNIEHLDHLMTASTWLGGLDLPVRLVAVPEGALQLFGVRPVLDAIRDVQALMREVGAAMAGRSARGDPIVDGFVEAWNDLRDEIMDAERRLVAAMRQDIGPHHAGSSEPD